MGSELTSKQKSLGTVFATRPGRLEFLRQQCDTIGLSPSSRILEIGCGTGEASCFLARRYQCPVVGIDLDEQHIQSAKATAKTQGVEQLASFSVSDITETLPAGTYDLVVMQGVLSHLPSHSATLDAIHELLNPRGFLVLEDFFSTSSPTCLKDDCRFYTATTSLFENMCSYPHFLKTAKSSGFSCKITAEKTDILAHLMQEIGIQETSRILKEFTEARGCEQGEEHFGIIYKQSLLQRDATRNSEEGTIHGHS